MIVVWASVTLVFIAMHIMRGSIADAILGPENVTPHQVAVVNRQYGLDKPILVQYWSYLTRMFSGNFGVSFHYHQNVSQVIGDRIGQTMVLAALSLMVAWILALTIVTFTAGRGRVRSGAGTALEILAVSVPQAWLGLVLLLVFSFKLGWFPIGGNDSAQSLVLPVITMALPLAGYLGQVSREVMEHTLEQPFVVTARSRGMSDRGVRWRHVLRHAALPGVTLSAFAAGWLFSGAVVVETVFGRPGVGSALVAAVQSKDIPLTGAIVMISAIMYVVANLIVDLLYPIIDPRILQHG